MQGRRVYSKDNKSSISLQEGDYGFDPRVGYWLIRPPGCHAGGIPFHEITEHEDGTITVSPSILLEDFDKTWHGYLEHGVWRDV